MELKKLSLDDIEKISPYFENITHRACDCTLGGVFIWRDYFENYFCIEDNTLIFAFGAEKKTYTYPIGENIDKAFLKIEKDAKEKLNNSLGTDVSKKILNAIEKTCEENAELKKQVNDFVYTFVKTYPRTGKDRISLASQGAINPDFVKPKSKITKFFVALNKFLFDME